METESVVPLEEGEIEDDSAESLDDVYVPLVRPETLPHAAPIITEPSDHEDEGEASADSSSGSEDSQPGRRRVKQKKRTARLQVQTHPLPPKKKKYNIWCTDATEDVLTNNLINCNVDQSIDRSRDVESYFPLSFSSLNRLKNAGSVSANPPVKERLGNKRSHEGRPKATGRRKLKNVPEPEVELTSKELLPLVKTIDDSAEELATDIANKLLEEKESVIRNVVDVLGKEKAIALFEETVQVEKNGGLLVMNGTRRRTPGGVFFFLLKSSPDVQPQRISEIFKEDRRQNAREIKAAKRREALRKEDYPTLLSKAEAAILKMKETREEDGGEEVKNPPPSPATDGRDNSSDGEESKLDTEGEIILIRSEDNMDI